MNPDCRMRMVLTWTPSKSSATAESNAAEMLDDPTPRRLSWAPEPEPPIWTFSVGMRVTTSSILSKSNRSTSAPPMAVTATGTSCRVSSCLRAVTVMLSVLWTAGGGASCAHAGAATATPASSDAESARAAPARTPYLTFMVHPPIQYGCTVIFILRFIYYCTAIIFRMAVR